MAETSLRTRREHLERCARTIRVDSPWSVSGDRLLEWFGAQNWQRETRRGHRTTLRVFYGWALESGQITESPARLLPRVKPGTPRPRPLPDEPYLRAVRMAKPRELLMLRLGVELGMRRKEIACAHSRDLFEDLEGWSIVVHGKGDKERIVPVPDNLALVLRSMPRGWLFPGADHGHLSPRWVGKLLGRMLPPGFTAHTLRHRFARKTHEASGGDLLVVQKLLGHASAETTRVYVPVPDARLRAAVNGAAA